MDSLPAPYFQDDSVTIYHADCRDILPLLSGISAVVTDPPYHLTALSRNGSPRMNDPETPYGRHHIGDKGFMGQTWDGGDIAFAPHTWELVAAACLPGAPLLAFGGTRTWHRMVCAIEDAGWEIRDTLMWLYGSGFPKSLDISKAIGKAAGAEREVVGIKWGNSTESERVAMESRPHRGKVAFTSPNCEETLPATSAAKEWQGYGTALKPAWEPICLAMKPTDGTFAHNALTHGVAGLNIDGCRIGIANTQHVKAGGSGDFPHEDDTWKPKPILAGSPCGRWPANLLLDEEAARMLDEQSGILTSGNYPAVRHADKHQNVYQGWKGEQCLVHRGTDSGGASRFFYTAKASRGERDPLCEELLKNDHPTVKPLDLMVYLIKLVMPPKNGVVLDTFMGSGTTGLACQRLGLCFIGIDNNERNVEIAAKRMSQGVLL